MAALIPDLRSETATPLVEQIARFYQGVIEDGGLRPGERLPTIRAVAEHLGVTRTTVQQAYRRLADHGLVTATVGRGTIVAELGDPELTGPVGRFALDTWRHLREGTPGQADADTPAVLADFADLRPDAGLFPVEAFRAAIERQLRERGAELLAYGDPTGSRALREYLATCPDAADASTDPDEIQITSGAQQGIDLVVRTLTSPGAAVAATVPTYHQLFGTLKTHGVRLAPVRSTEGGIDLADLRRVLSRSDVELLYVMPTFHNPTGRTLDEAQRREIVAIASEAGVPILEDEFECELRFAGESLPTLRSLDERGWTSTVRSFSKGLFPGVRVGWVHGGRALLGPLSAMKRYADLGTSPLMQASVADFVAEGGMARHLDAVRGELRTRHAEAQSCLRRSGLAKKGVRWTEPLGGFALWIQLPPGSDDVAVAREAAERGVRLTPGRVFDPFELSEPGLRLSLSRSPVAAVRAGLDILLGLLHEIVGDSTAGSTAESLRSDPPLLL